VEHGNVPSPRFHHVAKGLPRMTATIPGQYDSQHGIDIIAIDAHNPRRRMWLIEISRGREMGAGLVKQLDKRKYAGYQSQMSYRWRRAAADLFLQKNPKSTQGLLGDEDVMDDPSAELPRLNTSKPAINH
jgi:hypothetical protein